METKHTQGEWYVVPRMSKHEYYIAIASTCKKDRQWIAEAKSSHVNNGMTDEEFFANAKLIAASPDLLEACEKLISLLKFHGYLHSAEISKAEEAIKKAKGE